MIAADPTGISRRRGQAGDAGQPVDGVEHGDIAGGVGQERRAQGDPKARHAQQGLRVTVPVERLLDLLVEHGDVAVKRMIWWANFATICAATV